jgi:hypothetical protein
MPIQATDPDSQLRGWIALAISIAALLQVWAIAGWKRFIRRGTLRVHETGTLEAGYSTFGPTLALLGTLRAINQEVFIESMSVRVIRVRDKAERVLRWRAFRSSGINAPASAPQLDLPRSFLVQPTAPHNYNIVFADEEFESEFRSRLNEVPERWRTFLQAAVAKGNIPPENLDKLLSEANASQIFWSEFAKDPWVVELYAAVSERFFWHAGEYDVALETRVSSPGQTTAAGWRFDITEQDSKALRTNAFGILRAQSGYNAFLHFAYPQYAPLPPDRQRAMSAHAP